MKTRTKYHPFIRPKFTYKELKQKSVDVPIVNKNKNKTNKGCIRVDIEIQKLTKWSILEPSLKYFRIGR